MDMMWNFEAEANGTIITTEKAPEVERDVIEEVDTFGVALSRVPDNGAIRIDTKREIFVILSAPKENGQKG